MSLDSQPGIYVEIGTIAEQPDMMSAKGAASWTGVGDGWHPGDAGHAEIASSVSYALDLGR